MLNKLLYIFFLLSIIYISGCEGDQGPAGPAGGVTELIINVQNNRIKSLFWMDKSKEIDSLKN